jgi:DNA-binding GntR family transcriptional regulator
MGAYAFLFWSNVRSDANPDDRLNPLLSMHRANPSVPAMARQTLRYTQLDLTTPARRKESARNWRTMQRALKSGDVDAAAKAVEKLIDDSRREAVEQLEARQGAATLRVRGV